MTFRIERATRVRVGKIAGVVQWEDRWEPVKSGLTKERAEELVAMAKRDTRGCLWTLRVEEER